LPGFVSLKIDRLIKPGAKPAATHLVLEAFAYSLINGGLMTWPILVAAAELAQPHPVYAKLAGLAFLICVAGPMTWPFLFRRVQAAGAKRGWLLGQHAFAWDAFFESKKPCWLIVHLNDKSLVGGYFGQRSYATVEPQSGHIYLEELWRLDESGRFVAAIEGSKGALFRPQDYVWLEAFWDGPPDPIM
jgi:hypothetical protein